jgi:hypothetical protein
MPLQGQQYFFSPDNSKDSVWLKDESQMLNRNKNVQECDATGLNSSTEAGYIEIAFLVNQLTLQILTVSYLRTSN